MRPLNSRLSKYVAFNPVPTSVAVSTGSAGGFFGAPACSRLLAHAATHLEAAGFTLDGAAQQLEFRYAATDEQFPTIAKVRAAAAKSLDEWG